MANSWWIYIVLIGLILVMLVLPMITNRKRTKEYNNMLDNIRVGDTIRTVGGIIGRITKINDKDGYKTIIIETGAKNAKTTMELDMASIYGVINSTKAVAPKVEEQKEEVKAEEVKAEATEETKEEKVEEAKEQKTEAKKETSKKPAKKAKKSK